MADNGIDGMAERQAERARRPRNQARRSAGGYQNQPGTQPARKGPPDKRQCPADWDTAIWGLALLFDDRALEAGITLRAGRHLVYAEIDELVTRCGIRNQTFRHEVHGCQRRELPYYLAARCWYHYPPMSLTGHDARDITWWQMVEIIIAEFWSRIQNEYALDQFRQSFREYGEAAVKHWNSLRVLQDVQRQMSGATMQDASKEG